MSTTLYWFIFEEEGIFYRKKNYYENTLAFSLENYNQKPQQLLRWKKEKQWNVFLSWDFSRKWVLSWPAVPIPSLFKGSLFDLDFGCDSIVILRGKVRVMVSLNPCGQKLPGGIPIFLKPPELPQGNEIFLSCWEDTGFLLFWLQSCLGAINYSSLPFPHGHTV